MNRKILALLLALTLCVGMAVPAFAVEEDPTTTTPETTAEETTTETPTENPAEGSTEDPATETPADPTSPTWTIDDAAAKAAADKLNELGLFQGVGDNEDGTPNYDLNRAPNRMEAVTMLVRLLGKDAAATAGTWEIPFTDVADWAKPYVGYAYANGLTQGTSATTFDGTSTVSASEYLTFVLRALGYDSSTDFAWNAAWELSDKLGITAGQYQEIPAGDFLRANVVVVSVAALDVKLKDSEKTLLTVIQENLAGITNGDSDVDDTKTEDPEADGTETDGADTDETKTDETKTEK